MPRSRVLRLLSAALLAFALLGRPVTFAYADSIQVNTTDDELNTDGDCSLREAIQSANADQALSGCGAGHGADIILVPPGRYRLTLQGFGESSGGTGDLDILSNISLIGSGVDSTILDGGQYDRVLETIGNRTLLLQDLTVTGGATGMGSNGGGIYIGMGGIVTLLRVNVTGNSGSHGGAIINVGTLSVTDSQISGNAAFYDGGALRNDTLATFVNSTVSGNTATYGVGGGILTGGTLTLINTTISGNQAKTDGGGIYNARGLSVPASLVSLYNVTITGNTSDSDHDGIGAGGGIYTVSPPSLSYLANTILAGNFGPSSSPNCLGPVISLGNNLFGDTTGCTINGTTTGNQTGVNPMLGPLGDNGGLTPTHALLPGSPAIDRGAAAGCVDNLGAAIRRDQRDMGRPTDGDFDHNFRCDIGAFEFGSTVYVPFTIK